MQERLKEILDNHSKAIEGTAKEIISELKAKTNTYGELAKELNRFEQGIRWKSAEAQKHQFLLSEIKMILEREKNNLLIKNNNTRVISGKYIYGVDLCDKKDLTVVLSFDSDGFKKDLTKRLIREIEEHKRSVGDYTQCSYE